MQTYRLARHKSDRGLEADRTHMLRSMPLKFVATKTRGSTLRVPA
jgi:hypothetical protein